jgi:iron complex transport system substrate-binding protein
MRIISLLPAATEIVAALGLLDHLVGVSHECDFPVEVNALPRVMTCPIYKAGLTSAEIDARVRESIARELPLYQIDIPLLESLQPDLVLSQMLCDVCAIGYGTVAGALASIASTSGRRPRLLNLEPRRLDDLYANIREVAAAVDEISTEPLDAAARAEVVIDDLKRRVTEVADRASKTVTRPRVLFLEWIDPPFGAGHWTPELIEIAGGECVLGTAGVPSRTYEWDEVVTSRPDVVVVACCGYDVETIERDMALIVDKAGWRGLHAVRSGRVHVVDGSHFFNRPGPRLIDSLEILASIIQPEVFDAVERRGIAFPTTR